MTEPVTDIWELWDQDDTFEELHLSGSLEELLEAAGEEKQLKRAEPMK